MPLYRSEKPLRVKFYKILVVNQVCSVKEKELCMALRILIHQQSPVSISMNSIDKIWKRTGRSLGRGGERRDKNNQYIHKFVSRMGWRSQSHKVDYTKEKRCVVSLGLISIKMSNMVLFTKEKETSKCFC